MQTVVWTPRLFLAACALAIGVVAATPASDAAAPDDSGAPDDATTADGATGDAATNDGCVLPTTLPEDGGPNAEELSGPPSDDGSLDDGYAPPFTLNNGDALGYLGICQTLPAPFVYSAVKAPYTDVAGCMAFDNEGHPNAHNCLCQKCFSLIQQCDSLPTCQVILKCNEDTGCKGSDGCYLFPTGAGCVAQINNAGTGSVATFIEQAIGTCGTSNNCPAQ
jgi:hypothetical protein